MKRETMKAEAIERMKALKIFSDTIKQFQREDLVSSSEPPVGACFWLDDEQRERVRELEDKHNLLVYHMIHCYTNFGEMECYLYVSGYESDWLYDHENMKENIITVYAYNKTHPEYSEFGSIGVELTIAHCLKRIW